MNTPASEIACGEPKCTGASCGATDAGALAAAGAGGIQTEKPATPPISRSALKRRSRLAHSFIGVLLRGTTTGQRQVRQPSPDDGTGGAEKRCPFPVRGRGSVVKGS